MRNASIDNNITFINQLASLIETSYANNSKIYEHVNNAASLEEIALFFRSSSGQSPFNVFLRQWMPLIPESIRSPYEKHLHIEEVEDHAGMAKKMRENLYSRIKTLPPANDEMAETIGYSFSPERINDKNVGYFLGCFMATEALSAKRSLQLYNGLKRNQMTDEELQFLKIHLEADSHHSEEVGTEMILPAIKENPDLLFSIMEGVTDRLCRSTTHLKWYEQKNLKN